MSRLSTKTIDETGKTYGLLTVLGAVGSRVEGRSRRAMWRCRCTCGVEITTRGNRLRSGTATSCGKCSHIRHGHAVGHKQSRTYKTWSLMLNRCLNPRYRKYKDYGGRGITVCQSWQDSFENFLADMGERPAGCTIDRKDNDGNYEPGNSRWATAAVQNKNRRTSRKASSIDE